LLADGAACAAGSTPSRPALALCGVTGATKLDRETLPKGGAIIG